MADEFKPVHGFYLNVADSQGKPTIFVWPVFPEYVTRIEPKASGGCSVTVKIAEKEPFTVDVVQNAEFVNEAMRRCIELDKNPAASASGRVPK